MRYAQEFSGQRLHIVHEYTDGSVDGRAFCGRTPLKRGTWRMTINVPLGNACKRCTAIANKRYPPRSVDIEAFRRTLDAAIGIAQSIKEHTT